MQRPLLQLLLLSLLVVSAYGCGGGGGSGSDTETIAEGVAVEEIPPEDLGFAGKDLVPPSFVVVTPGTGADKGDWVTWPESLAKNVLDANNIYANSEQALSWPVNGVGIYASRADCSGYVTRSLMKAFEFTADDITAWMGSGSVRAEDHRFHLVPAQHRRHAKRHRCQRRRPGRRRPWDDAPLRRRIVRSDHRLHVEPVEWLRLLHGNQPRRRPTQPDGRTDDVHPVSGSGR